MGGTWLQKHPVRCRTVVGSNQADTTKGYTLKFTGHSNPRRRSLTLIRIYGLTLPLSNLSQWAARTKTGF